MTTAQPLSEAEARTILENVRSQAADPALFTARREVGGWVFSWADRSKPAPIGVRSEVVTDSGKRGRLQIGETGSEAIRRLSR